MAEKWAVSNGNWSDAATWNGGTKPTAGDVVWANGFTVAIDEDVTVAELRTDNTAATALEGGVFSTSGSVTVTADVYAGRTDGITVNSGGVLIGDSYGSLYDTSEYGARINGGAHQIGNSTGGSVSGAYGTYCTSGGYQIGNSLGGSVNSTPGTYCTLGGYQIGNSAGGSGGSAYGTHCTSGGYQIGNSTGGSGSSTPGTYCTSGGYQIGNSTGGPATNSYGTDCANGGYQIGNSAGGSGISSYGTRCTNGGYQIGNSTGGSAANAFGTYCISGACQIGNSTGGSVSSAYGTFCNGGYHVVGEITNSTGNALYGLNSFYLFFGSVTLADVTGSGNTELSESDYWSLATENRWGPIFAPTGGGSSLPLIGLGGLVY